MQPVLKAGRQRPAGTWRNRDQNVNDRIKIYFGEKYGISIESELDEGTCVTIRMPKVKGVKCKHEEMGT